MYMSGPQSKVTGEVAKILREMSSKPSPYAVP